MRTRTKSIASRRCLGALPSVNSTRFMIHVSAFNELLDTLMSRPVESGGILLGPKGGEVISHFVLDTGASCTGATYCPDHVTLNRRLLEEWHPAGLAFKGFAHSHPPGCSQLSYGDRVYIEAILQSNSALQVFYAPIVLPDCFRLRPFVVHRDGLRIEEVDLEIVTNPDVI